MESKSSITYDQYDIAYEKLAINVFDCKSRSCDPFGIADADVANYFVQGTLEGKKNISLIISRLVFLDELQAKKQQEGLKLKVFRSRLVEIYKNVWELPDISKDKNPYSTEAFHILLYLIDISEHLTGQKIII